MNTNDSSSLIDESEIRAALSFLRIDRDAFGHGVRERVRQRVEQAVVRPANTDDPNLEDRHGLLRIAASVLPVNLLGASAKVTQTSWAAMGVFQKAIACLALPAISLLMVAVTIRSWSRIRSAQRSRSLPNADMARMQESLLGWWQRYRWIATVVLVLTVAAPFAGWTTPLLLLFIASAIGTASIVTTLGRAGLVDRNVIGGNSIATLGLLGQVSLIFANTNHTQLLDPYLVPATFLAGSAFLCFFSKPIAPPSSIDARQSVSRRIIFLFSAGISLIVLVLLWLSGLKSLLIIVAICALVLVGIILLLYRGWPINGIVVRGVFLALSVGLTAFVGQTLWWPIRTSTLVKQAETFEPGYWPYWQTTDRWLQDQGINYDRSTVQARWQDALDEDGADRSYLLNHAVSTGMKFPSELIETRKFKARARLLLSTRSAGTLISLNKNEYIIALLAEGGALTDEQRDHLAGRLLATWRSLGDDRIQKSLVDATIITNLLSLIDRPLAEAERKADVVRWLGEYQVIDNRPFALPGGFRRYSNPDSDLPTHWLSGETSDALSTDHAVRLMQHYGTHESVDVLALRAFLRPAMSDRFVLRYACVRAATLQRLDQIPGIPRPSLWDQFRLNQSLWFAMLLVGLCIYATLGSPQILKEANDQD